MGLEVCREFPNREPALLGSGYVWVCMGMYWDLGIGFGEWGPGVDGFGGEYSIYWEPKSKASGIYFVVMSNGIEKNMTRITLLK